MVLVLMVLVLVAVVLNGCVNNCGGTNNVRHRKKACVLRPSECSTALIRSCSSSGRFTLWQSQQLQSGLQKICFEKHSQYLMCVCV